MKTFIFLIVAGIIAVLSWSYKKVDNAVDEYKLERDPNDIKTLEKYLLKFISNKNSSEAMEYCNRIFSINPSNIIALLFISSYYHERGDYQDSEKNLRRLVLDLLDRDAQTKLFRWTSSKEEETLRELVAKSFYYYGHILFRNGNQTDAMDWKKKAKRYNRGVLERGLY